MHPVATKRAIRPILKSADLGLIKSSPKKILAQGTDWRFLNELRKENVPIPVDTRRGSIVLSDMDFDGLVGRLSSVPRRIAHAIEGLSSAELRTAPNGEWSIAQVLAHLRASDDILAYRIYCMLARDEPPLPAYDERRWAEVAGYTQTADPRGLLDVYIGRRAELVDLLRRIPLADWQRAGTHEKRGPITIAGVTTDLVEHEEEHCQQIDRLVISARAPGR
jgi:DinB superfamily